MSYELYLFKPRAGIDPLETVEELFSGEEISPSFPQPEKEIRKHRLADALKNLNPELEVFAFGFNEMSEMDSIFEEEENVNHRHLELNEAEADNGIQITLYDDKANITIPFWHRGEKAKRVFGEIWNYLLLLEKEADFVTVDPQLGKILNLSGDMPEVLEVYENVVKSI
ncbi:MAG: hypothetical protein M3033_17065 [Acidobacteriota bacterium]|nr:hypothetical protein [Acidobacteriota bacterium]